MPIDIGNVDYSKMQKQQKEMNRRIIGRILLTDYKFKGGQKEYLFRIEDKNSRDVVDKYLKIEKKKSICNIRSAWSNYSTMMIAI